jgi:hypothetical protein
MLLPLEEVFLMVFRPWDFPMSILKLVAGTALLILLNITMSCIIIDKQDSDIWQRTSDAWITKFNSEV